MTPQQASELSPGVSLDAVRRQAETTWQQIADDSSHRITDETVKILAVYLSAVLAESDEPVGLAERLQYANEELRDDPNYPRHNRSTAVMLGRGIIKRALNNPRG